jgi:Flp pilus assembly pilin Flp
MRKANPKLLGGRGGLKAIELSMIASLVAVIIVGGLQTLGPSMARTTVKTSMLVADDR